MPKVRTPFCSLDASGTVGKSLIVRHQHGQHIVDKYYIPSDPKSAEQLAHRAEFKTVTLAVNNNITQQLLKDAWRRLATYTRTHLTWDNGASKNVWTALDTIANPSFAVNVSDSVWQGVDITLDQIVFGGPVPESGLYTTFVGADPAKLLWYSQQLTVSNVLHVWNIGDPGDVRYISLEKADAQRVGILRVVVPGPVAPIYTAAGALPPNFANGPYQLIGNWFDSPLYARQAGGYWMWTEPTIARVANQHPQDTGFPTVEWRKPAGLPLTGTYTPHAGALADLIVAL